MKIRKPIFAFLILLILTVIMGFVIVTINYTARVKELDFQNSLISKNAVDSLKMIEKEMNRTYDSALKKTDAGIDLAILTMEAVSDGDIASAPQLFDDGIIVRLKGEEIVYPGDFPWRFEGLDAKTLQDEPSLYEMIMLDGSGEAIGKSLLTIRHITDDFWYVDMTSEAESEEIYDDQEAIFSEIKDLQAAFDGYIFLIDMKSPNLSLIYAPDEFEDVVNAEDLGITQEMIDSKVGLIPLRGRSYSAQYASVRMFSIPMTAVILINSTDELMNIANNTGAILAMLFITVSAVILWLYWVQTYVRDHEVTEVQKKEYHPGQIRRKLRSIGLTGTIVFFLLAVSLESLGSLSLESTKNNKRVNLLERKMDANSSMVSLYRDDEEDWTVYYTEQLTPLITRYPDLLTMGFLFEVNQIIGSEYIMIFDADGREIQCSSSYIGLNLTTDLVSSGSELERLLHGAPTVVLDPQEDLLTGKTVQLFGVPVYGDDSQNSGAVVIAIDPESSWLAEERENYSTFLDMLTPAGNFAFVVDKESGKVLYTNQKEYKGENAGEIGLYAGDARDTELDSFKLVIESKTMLSYGAYQKDENYQYYYMTLSDVFQHSVLPFGLISAAGFLLIFWIVTAFMVHPYRSEVYSETVRVSASAMQDSYFDESLNMEWMRLQAEGDEQENLRDLWRKLLPERKASIFIQMALALLLIAGISMTFGSRTSAAMFSIDFILQGNWTRGINLMSFAGILLLIISFIIFVLFKNLLLNLIGNVLDRKAETVFRLTFSFIQYAAIIVVLYFAFDFLGFDTRTLLASVSFLSLAVTLGARDLVADILAGIFIIFEDDFHVGDIIEVNGFSGIVQEIGVRSTRLIGIGDNVKIIGNQAVKNVLNMSKMNSWYSIDLNVPADQPLKEIEAMLERELPKIGESITEILSGPYYKGVMAIGTVNTLYIIAECKQECYRIVQRKLNRALLDLFAENGYKIC